MLEEVDAEEWCDGIIVEDSDSMELTRDRSCCLAPRSSHGARPFSRLRPLGQSEHRSSGSVSVEFGA